MTQKQTIREDFRKAFSAAYRNDNIFAAEKTVMDALDTALTSMKEKIEELKGEAFHHDLHKSYATAKDEDISIINEVLNG